MTYRLPFHIHLSTAFMALMIMIGLMIGGLAYSQSKGIIENLTTKTFDRIAQESVLQTQKLFQTGKTLTHLLSAHEIVSAPDWAARSKHIPFLLQALESSETITSVFIGYPDGDFLLVRRAPVDASFKDLFRAPENTAYIAQSIDRNNNTVKGLYAFYRRDFSFIFQEMREDYRKYDPRERGWFQKASASEEPVVTSPYLFFTTKEMGTTVAQKSMSGGTVVATDITLNTLALTLENFKITPGTEVALVSRDGKLAAHPDPSRVVDQQRGDELQTQAHLSSLDNQAITQAFDAYSPEQNVTVSHQEMTDSGLWQTMATTVPLNHNNSLILLLAAPKSELMTDVNQMLMNAAVSLVAAIIIILPFSFLFGRVLSRPLISLTKQTKAVRNFDFSNIDALPSAIQEVDDLSKSLMGMKSTIQQFLDISTAIAEESDFDRLQDVLLDETMATANASIGVVYLLNNEETHLVPTNIRNDNRKDIQEPLPSVSMTDLPLALENAIETNSISQTTLSEADGDKTGLTTLSQKLGLQASNLVSIPLSNRHKELIGVLALTTNEELGATYLSFLKALSGSAVVSIESRQMIDAQKALFDSFVRIIAGAIDAKSAYTGSHCERVPDLTKMLAKAAVDTSSEPFKDFDLDDDDWEAIHVASWLHDCGKVTTPEFVMDKATKLETIYDRIHEIRTRFEVLRRDAEILYWKEVSEGIAPATAREKMDRTISELEIDFEFLASCNLGGEFLGQDKIDKIRTIGSRTWIRNFDNTLGISHEQKERLASQGSTEALPATEYLLTDRPDHRIEKRDKDRFDTDNPWGFKMEVPDLLYNQGELHNLTISKGTLTPEERFKINEHIMQTIIMLRQLPYPKHLRAVPEIAGGHHEKMDGTGYPLQLHQHELSPLARMMAVADIFEALTAIDRPYKKGKTLSESLEIMASMRDNHHIDSDLFELFLTSGVYKEYAHKHMKDHQIDEVDVTRFL